MSKTDISQAELAHQLVREMLVTLRIAPGDPVREENLMLETGLGRTPIREAIKRLENEQLIVVYSRRGTFATTLRLEDLHQLTEVRTALEAKAAALAARRITTNQKVRLQELVAALDTCREPEDFIRADTAIHTLIYQAAHNQYLEKPLEQYFNLAMRMWYAYIDRLEKIATHVAEHAALAEAIIAGEPELAAQLASEHIESFQRGITRAMGL